ncbi:hypothetical protein DL96DRAFT_1714128 [Flagelloscypha sp. PMI_526]|nr:hypothetical protein DL96DRAFT_1714128 [Flagelloscypha sp. PMI_526]
MSSSQAPDHDINAPSAPEVPVESDLNTENGSHNMAPTSTPHVDPEILAQIEEVKKVMAEHFVHECRCDLTDLDERTEQLRESAKMFRIGAEKRRARESRLM